MSATHLRWPPCGRGHLSPVLCRRYGLRYSAKVLRDSLQAKFPGASQDELYKVSTGRGGALASDL